jgi:acetoin utilization protein AcuB
MKALQAMTRNVVCIHEDDSLEVARDIMREWEIRHLPVVRGRALVGVLSDRDLLLYTEAGRANCPQIAERSVGETMSKRPVTCRAGDSISHIAGIMVENKIDCIPVIEDDDGEVIGMITSTDMLELLRERDILDASRTVPWSYAVRMMGREGAGYV